MASRNNDVIENRVKRCNNRHCGTADSLVDAVDDTDLSKGSHLKKREQHSCRNFPGLPPSKAFQPRSYLTADSPPSENDDDGEPLATLANTCDMAGQPGPETMKQSLPPTEVPVMSNSVGPSVPHVGIPAAKPTPAVKNCQVRLNGVTPVLSDTGATSAKVPSKEGKQAESASKAAVSKTESPKSKCQATETPSKAEKAVPPTTRTAAVSGKEGKHKGEPVSSSFSSKSCPKEKAKRLEPPDKKQKIAATDRGSKASKESSPKEKPSSSPVKSSGAVVCSRCKRKCSVQRNVGIQCKKDRHCSSGGSVPSAGSGPWSQVPRLPPSSEFSKLRLGRFVRREVHPNGGASVLHLYWDEISHLEAADLNRLAKDFLKETFYEDPPGVAKYVMGIVHGAAQGLPDLVDYFAEHHPNLVVKCGVLGRQSDIETTSMARFQEMVSRTYSSGTFRSGPLHQMSLVGTVHEEVGGFFPEFLALLERCPFLHLSMPWGPLSAVRMDSPQVPLACLLFC